MTDDDDPTTDYPTPKAWIQRGLDQGTSFDRDLSSDRKKVTKP